jgi:FAD/FMN-containing dehydrogenase/Fe-S oxidoreductase
MTVSLTVLREEAQHERFERQRRDDARTAIPADAARGLESDLQKRVRGEVRFDAGSRALYATDASNYRQAPIGVVVPRDADDVVAAVDLCRQYGAPVLPRGGGTSLAGQCCNVAVVLDFTKYMHRVQRVDAETRLGTTEPGCVLDRLREAAEEHHLTFGPDPSTHSHCAIGGMIGNDSCGSHSLIAVHAGRGMRVADNTHELDVLTYDGLRLRVGQTPADELDRVVRAGGPRGELYGRLRSLRDKYADEIRRGFPKLPRRVSGYNLDELLPENGFHVARALVGSEGTLAIVLEATLHLVPSPPGRVLLLLGYPDICAAGDQVMAIREFQPTALEGIDHLLFDYVCRKGDRDASLELFPDGRGFLIVEFGGENVGDAEAAARRCVDALKRGLSPPSMNLVRDARAQHMIWTVREGGLGATAWVPGLPDAWPGWEDSAVPPEKVGPYLRDLRKLFDKFEFNPSVYGHLGQGCIHCRIPFDMSSDNGLRQYRAFVQEAADLVSRYGGSYSGEHGDGQSRGPLLRKMFGDTLYEAFREFKAIWDPNGRMNPGKKIDAYDLTENLRLGADYVPPGPPTHFHYPEDKGRFDRAVLRCVGVGKCRVDDGQVMCPSYMVTREEKHSTRGRARLLWEMMNGEVLTDGWRSEAVKEALDLCLACKGCKHDCPVSVDMATYKAEFLSHYYAGRLRPRHAYAMGLIHWWARLASFAPGLANLVGRTPGLGAAAKWLGGIAQRRPLPCFAGQTFKDWFFRRPSGDPAGRPMVLWADTFTNFFHPEPGKAAVEVLENAGCRVLVPRAALCCGRPLYDFGMLDRAKGQLREILTALGPAVEAGLPLVGLEPSCTAVFRDELVGLFPDDPVARRLADQTFTLAEFLTRRADGFRPPAVGGRAILHAHCHQKSVLTTEPDRDLLRDMSVAVQEPEPGCCGLAGSFGFEAGMYDVSMAIGERRLLPAVRDAGPDILPVADGFSCRTQIEHGTGRRAKHLAEVIRDGLGHAARPAARHEQTRVEV